MKQYYGNYLGLVIEDFDPEHRNRVKVFVPAVSTTILANLNAKKQDVSITGVGINLPNSLDIDTYKELINILPWAECAAPLFGGGTSQHFNPVTNTATNKSNVASLTGLQPTIDAGDELKTTVPGFNSDSFANPDNASSATPSTNNEVSTRVVEFIKKIEGLENPSADKKHSTAIWDYAQWSVGYGSRAKYPGETITIEEAETRLIQELSTHAKNVDSIISKTGIQLNTAQRDALISYDYNTGKASSILAKINGDPSLISSAILNGIQTANGKVLSTLVERRKKEATLAAEEEGTYTNNSKFTSDRLGSVPDKYNENSFDINGTYTSSIPGGMFSTPKVNSHVWVFFNGGDPQYPVYFAQHIINADWQRVKQVSSPPSKSNISTATSKSINSSMAQPGAGIVEFITQQELNTTTNLMDNRSGIKISTASGGSLSYTNRGHIEYAPVNKTIKVGGDKFLTVEGNYEIAIKSSTTMFVAEDQTTIVGDISDTSIQAAKNIVNLLKIGHDQVVIQSKIPSTKRIPCPICNAPVINTSGGLLWKLASRAGGAILNLVPKDTIASRFLAEILPDVTTPMSSSTNKKIRKESSCGNKNCENNTIPDFHANTPDIEATNIQYQESIFDKILQNEQQLGIGGNQTTIIAKNAVTKVGLVTNNLDSIVKLDNSFPIKNGMDFIPRRGVVAKGDAVPTYKILDVPGPPTGFYELFVGTKYNLKVGSRGIHIQTLGNIELDGAHFELTANFISLGNESGVTKINGGAVIIEAKKSITLGGAPTNVHVNGTLHANANITAGGSVFANGSIYAKKLVVPYTIQKTDMSATADSTTGSTVWSAAAVASFNASTALKKTRHYNPLLSGMYPATPAGMNDVIIDWISRAQLALPYDNWGAPAGMFYGVGSGPVFVFPHVHNIHNNSHSHSFKGPDGEYLNDADEIYSRAAFCGSVIPDLT